MLGSWHGFALNVSADLRGFAAITPCGIEGVTMTSVEREGGPADVEQMGELVAARFVRHFGYAAWRALPVDRVADDAGARA